MADEILDVDLLSFEQGDAPARRAVVDGVRRSLQTGFVYTSHDLSEDLLDQAYDMLAEFFSRPTDEKLKYVAPGSHGQTGYTGLLVETAASSDVPDWKEMLNWGREAPTGHPLRTRFPHRYGPQVLPEGAVPGISDVLNQFHDRIADLQRRFLRIIAVAVGCHENFFDADAPPRSAPDPRHPLPGDGPRSGPGPRLGRLPRRHQPHHRTPPGQRPWPAGGDRQRLGATRWPPRGRSSSTPG